MPDVFVESSPCLISETLSLPTKSSFMRRGFGDGGPTSALTSDAWPMTPMSNLWYETVGPGERLTQGDAG